MAIATLESIIFKIRKITSSSNDFVLTDDMIKDYINSFYLYDLPAEFRSLKLKDLYTFDTTEGIDTYAFDSERYTTVEAPCYCAGRQIQLFQSPNEYFTTNYNWQFSTNFATSDGTAGPYAGTASQVPFLRSVNNDPTNVNYPAGRVQNILITVNVELGSTLNVTDDGFGVLIGDCLAGGTIDYATGAIAGLTFTDSPPAGAIIQIQYNPINMSVPQYIMFFQDQFTLRPVPNQGYTVQLVAYRQPTQAMMETAADQGSPELKEWWELIAFGASKKIFEDRSNIEGVMFCDKTLIERYSVAESRTYAQIGSSQRVMTIYAQQLTNTLPPGATFWGGQ